jgi:hypothetical protein
MALHAVSTPGWLSARQLSTTLEFLLDTLLPRSTVVSR